MDDVTVVLATRNEGKIKEIKELLSGYPIGIKGLSDFGPIPRIIEDGDTFEDNAYKKAHQTAKFLGFPALADDSGLIVEALDGAPGVYSGRFAGEEATYEENNQKLLELLKDKTNRKAYFQTVIAIAVPRGPALIYEGRCDGEIGFKAKGGKGFGYDPLFFYPPSKKTFAQMSREEKNSISQRGRAIQEVRDELDKIMLWLNQRMLEEPFGKTDHCLL